ISVRGHVPTTRLRSAAFRTGSSSRRNPSRAAPMRSPSRPRSRADSGASCPMLRSMSFRSPMAAKARYTRSCARRRAAFKGRGYRFLDRDGRDLPEGGAALARLHHLEGQTDPRLIRPSIEVACDVRNPLLGPEGASAIYGPQKGATPQMVKDLDGALATYADVIEDFVGRNVRDVPGAGAAGGLGAGLVALLDARLRSGAELVLDATKFASRIAGADLVVTGEGRADAQSAYGKLTQAVTHAARDAGVRTAMVVGGTAAGYEVLLSQGVDAIEVS